MTHVSGVQVAQLEQELEQLFREHYQLVFRTAYGVTGSPEDAQDVLQTIFVRLLQREFPPDLKKNPRAYLYRAAVNASLNIIKSEKRQVLMDASELLEATATSDEAMSLELLHERLYKAMAKLSSDSAQLLILRYVHNYSDAEIARLLGKSRSLIAVRLFRSRARLKKLLREEQP